MAIPELETYDILKSDKKLRILLLKLCGVNQLFGLRLRP